MKVGLFIIGAAKSGTTALWHFLSEHPDISMYPGKEAHFFDHPHFEANKDYSIFESLFPIGSTTKLLGEASPSYIYLPECLDRISAYNPKAKIIVLLRNPVDRAYSHYMMEVWRGNEKLDLFEAHKKEKKRIAIDHLSKFKYSYFDRGFYTKQLKIVFKYFAVGQVLVIKTEDLMNNHEKTMKKIHQFLGVDHHKSTPQEVRHRATPWSYRKITNNERAHLHSLYQDEIKKLEELLGWNLTSWKKI